MKQRIIVTHTILHQTKEAERVQRMKRAVQDVEKHLLLLAGQVFASCRLGAWCFDEEKHLFLTTAPYQEEYHMFLRIGGCLQLAIDRMEDPGVPYIMSGNLGLAWIAEWVHLQNGGRLLVILGPAYLKNTPVEQSLRSLDRHGISQHLRRQYLTVLGDVPVLGFDMLRHYACILHYSCYLEGTSPVLLQENAPAAKGTGEVFRPAADKNDYQRMAACEEQLLYDLAKGVKTESIPNYCNSEMQDFELHDALRQIKDNLIIFTGLCSRVASKNGVPLYTARATENEWIRRIEALRGFSGAGKITEGMYNAFFRQIRQEKETGDLSSAVRECRTYIQMNYMKELTLEEIARHCGYAEYYLSRKFARETGIKLSEYIHQVRVDAAKTMLLTTSKEIQEISDDLHFGNRNHFDRVFRQRVGVSPARFREQAGQIEPFKERL